MLIRRTNTPGGPSNNTSYKRALPQRQQQLNTNLRPDLYRQGSTQERPPSSIFKVDPLILSIGYLRDIVKIEDIKIDIIPTKIYKLCKNYYAIKYKNMYLDSNNNLLKELIINRIDDQSYDNIELGHDTSILGKTQIMKMSSINNLKMDWNSMIKIDSNYQNATIVLTVFGDINMGKNTKLSCESNGNIYIKCNNLIMRTGSIISTTSNSYNKYQNGNKTDLKKFGNIYFIIRKSLIMDKMSIIKSGNIKIECQQMKLGIKSSIKALRKNLEILSKNGIISDGDLNEIFYAKNQKKIINKNELNNDKSQINKTIKENIGYKLTMFEENDDYDIDAECCICWERDPNIYLKPCCHSTFCNQCIDELNPIECPICRCIIKEVVRM